MSRAPVLLAVAAALAVPSTAAAAPTAIFGKCGPTAAPNARCGTVAAPLDRANPAGATIPIAFQLTPHSKPGAAVSAIVFSTGGPGLSNLASDPIYRGKLAALLGDHDVLAIDHRGIGASAAIDCPALQHVQGNQLEAAGACGASLGAAAYRYGSGDVADDIDDVRAALGIDKLDYYGVSYGAVDVRAYAYRHADHLRSAILDSPDFSSDDAFFRTLPGAMAKISVRVCQRSPACSAGERTPAKTLAALAKRLRTKPVTGTGYDATGGAHKLRVDEQSLLGILYDDYFADPAFLNQGEIFAAARALNAGDKTPLLRLAAESNAPPDFGDPAGLQSVGADYAVFCADSVFPWDKSASEATRDMQYATARDAIHDSATAPFTVEAWTNFIASQPTLLIPGADACTPWPAPIRPEPPFPPDQPFPVNVPALLFGGGLDYLDVDAEKTLKPLFPGAPFVEIANGGHVTTLWTKCGNQIAVHFLSTLQTGSTACAANPAGATGNPFGASAGELQIQGVNGFPERAADARAAAGTGTLHNRRLGAVAWSTVEDAVYQLARGGGNKGRGLRGGTFRAKIGTTKSTITLTRVRFATDVPISGKVTFTRSTSKVAGKVTAGGEKFTVSATLWSPTQPNATIHGTHLHATAPAR